MSKTLWTHEYYMDKFNKTEKSKYTNVLSECNGSASKVHLYCKKHSRDYWQEARLSIDRDGCLDCVSENRISYKKPNSHEKFINSFNEMPMSEHVIINGYYKSYNTPIECYCVKHNAVFYAKPTDLLNKRGRNCCPDCILDSRRNWQLKPHEVFIEQFNKVINLNYINILGIYDGQNKKIRCFCTIHKTEFYAWPNNLLKGHGCPQCDSDRSRVLYARTQEEYEQELLKINPLVRCLGKYVNCKTNIEHECLICGTKWNIAPSSLINAKSGCPTCVGSNFEKTTKEYLEYINLDFIPQKTYPDCKFEMPLRFDFYLNDFNILIECQGQQHYYPVCFGGISQERAEENFKLQQIKDNIKREYCKNNNIKLIEIPYWDIDKIPEILNRELGLESA